jgi:hypothetical protein
MATAFKEARKFQGERVRMHFDDGREVVALLLCATKDVDGSRHLIYDKVEPVSGAETGGAGAIGCLYADARSLVNIEAADAKKVPRTLRGWDGFGVPQKVKEASSRA